MEARPRSRVDGPTGRRRPWAAGEGFAVATGGYGGAMEAASKGAAEAGGQVIGVTCDRIEHWRGVRPNRWIGQEIRCRTLRQRLFRLIEIGQALIALPGGVGSLLEVALAWSLLQTQEIWPRPLVVVGKAWRRTLTAFSETADGYLLAEDAALVSFAADGAAAARLVVRGLGRGSFPG